MKHGLLGFSVLLLGIAAVGHVAISWVDRSNKQHALDLKYEEMKQYEFDLTMMKIAEIEVPILLEKKSGATYRFVLGSANSAPIWEQLQYTQFVSGSLITLPMPMPHGFSPGAKAPPLTAEERKKLEDIVSSRKGIRLDSLPNQPASSEETKPDRK